MPSPELARDIIRHAHVHKLTAAAVSRLFEIADSTLSQAETKDDLKMVTGYNLVYMYMDIGAGSSGIGVRE